MTEKRETSTRETGRATGYRTSRRPEALKGRSGIALIMVLSVVVILITVTVQMQWESRVYISLAANERDTLKAQYMARSALAFAKLIIHLQGTVDNMLKRFSKSFGGNPPNIQLWQLIPIDSGLARMVVGGGFGASEQNDLLAPVLGKPDEPGGETKDVVSDQSALQLGEAEGFGNFDGHFHADVKDEESRININIRPNDTKRVEMFKDQLRKLFRPTRFNMMFENPHENGDYYDREEMIATILDWIDPDLERQGFNGGDERDRMDDIEEDKRPPIKNHFFDSLEELRLVPGVTDQFWDFFAESFTVYRTQKINVNTADPQVLVSLIEQFTPDLLYTEEDLLSFANKILAFRDENYGFNNEEHFINTITGAGDYLDIELEEEAKARKEMKSMITVKPETFTIYAQGDAGEVMVTLHVVIKRDGTLLYYREE